MGNLHTINRTIGASQNPISPGAAFSPPTSPTNMPNGSPGGHEVYIAKNTSGNKVAEKVYDYIFKFANLQVLLLLSSIKFTCICTFCGTRYF